MNPPKGKQSVPRQRNSVKKHNHNFNDVLVLLINKIYNLINSGQIVGLFIMYLCYLILQVVEKLSQNDLAEFIRQLLSLNYFYAIPPSIVMLITIYWANKQKKVYEKKKSELIETRSRLMHGQSAGELQPLKKHRTSGINRMEHENDC